MPSLRILSRNGRVPSGRAYSCGGARGVRYGEVPDDLARVLPEILLGRPVEGAEVLKEGCVFRWREHVVKVADRRADAGFLGGSRLRRALRLALRLESVRTPRPLLLLERRRGWTVDRSLIVVEYIEGAHLSELWEDDRAVEAFPLFLARMHEAGILHGDLHPANSIWNGDEWVLIDLESLRGRLHRLLSKRFVVRQWTRLVHNLTYVAPAMEPRLRGMFTSYAEQRGLGWDLEATWERIRVGVRRIRTEAGLPEPDAGA